MSPGTGKRKTPGAMASHTTACIETKQQENATSGRGKKDVYKEAKKLKILEEPVIGAINRIFATYLFQSKKNFTDRIS